jgi:DNA-binding CsgD family transcriptional regulator
MRAWRRAQESQMKCGPDDCPIRVFSDLTPAEQRVERGRIAKKMSDQGFTEQQIAKQLGVDRSTISRDLSEFVHDAQIKKPAKTATNPKGAGRPKGRAPKAIEREEKVAALKDAGLTTAEIAVEVGLGERAVSQALEHVQIKREAEAQIDPSTLSLSAQQKLATAIKQHQQKLSAGYQAHIQEEIRKRLEETVLPHYREKQAEAEKVIKSRKGVMDKATFNRIRRCLHPDSRQSVTDKILGEAFDAFMALEKILLDEKDSPTEFTQLPSTYEAWEQMKRDAMAARRTKRSSNNHSAIRPR